MSLSRARRRQGADRIAPAIAALAVNAVIGYALVMGLRGVPLLRAVADDVPLRMFDLNPPAEMRPEPPPPVQPQPKKREGGAAPGPAARPAQNRPHAARPAEIAPQRMIAPPIPVFPAPSAANGASAIPSATGSGGGGGSGGDGSGSGSGSGTGDGGTFSPARQTGGRFRNADFPDWLRGAGRLKIGVRYAIGPSGRVDRCEVIEGSGYGEVDAMTCRIIMERYRFRPARDATGYPVTEVREEDYRWRVR